MDFRYILLCLPCSALAASEGVQEIRNKRAFFAACAVFAVFSALTLMMYTSGKY